MKHIQLIAFAIFIVLMLLAAAAVRAQTPPQKTYGLSAPLVEEIVARLSTNGLVAMLQAEAQHQPPPVTCPDKPAGTHMGTPGEAPK